MSYQYFRSFVTPARYFVKRYIHISKTSYGTHYDTLKLPRNCTSKEVRDSFIKLSKQCHPDRNQEDPNTHTEFVKLNEAYSVLSRPDKRKEYDLSLRSASSERYRRPPGSSPFDVYSTAYRQRVVWRDESFWEYKDKNTYGDFNQSGDYYGIRGLKRVPNGWIAIMCVVFAAVGVWIQVLLIKYSTAFNRNSLDERSHETSKALIDVQERAQRHGNKMQLELMKKQMDSSQNSSESSSQTSAPSHEENIALNPGSTSSYSNVIPDYTKVDLSYLGAVPHRIGIEIEPRENSLTPDLHNLARKREIENNMNDDLPKPILFSTPMKIEGRTDQSHIVVSNMLNDINKGNCIIEQNLSESAFSDLGGKSKQNQEVSIHTDDNVQILMLPELENRNEERIIENDFLGFNVANANKSIDFCDKQMASSSNR